jgi:hypothetical protein
MMFTRQTTITLAKRLMLAAGSGGGSGSGSGAVAAAAVLYEARRLGSTGLDVGLSLRGKTMGRG